MLEMKPEGLSSMRPRPRSPNIQNYRPQLTSVLSIANRITALVSTVAMVAFVAWLIAAELSSRSYDAMYGAADKGASSPSVCRGKMWQQAIALLLDHYIARAAQPFQRRPVEYREFPAA